MSQKYINNENIFESLASVIEEYDAKHIFLVRGRRSYEDCGAKYVVDAIQKETKFELTEFADFSANPKIEEVAIGVEKILQAKPNLILAIGGGSAMDTAKLIRHYAAEKGKSIPLCAIPTTAGTGAEATHFAVVYQKGVKTSIEADDILPDVAILYPPFTYGNNGYLTACTGFDALAQAIEAYWNPKANDESREYSKCAIKLIYKQLPKCIEHPEQVGLRDELIQGAYWAGRAINITKTTAPHAFSYVFTSKYGYPHGHAVALTFPFFMKLNGTPSLFELLGMSADNVVQQIEDYISSLGLSLKLQEAVDVNGALKEVNLQRLANNPVKVNQGIIEELERYLEKYQYD